MRWAAAQLGAQCAREEESQRILNVVAPHEMFPKAELPVKGMLRFGRGEGNAHSLLPVFEYPVRALNRAAFGAILCRVLFE